MPVLLDTNILVRLANPRSLQAAIAERALNALCTSGEELRIVPQNLVEFWAVATRPISANGLGLTIEEAIDKMSAFKSLFVLLPELPLQFEWERLVERYSVSGKSCHDARLVAAMTVHGTQKILTFNTQDFTRYDGITVLDPRTVS
jgi:predicted nucleic acid-binding protein